jgi:hypothetical protein
VLQRWLAPMDIGLLIAVSAPVEPGGACTVTATHMRVADPGSIVGIIVAFWLVLWLVLAHRFGQLVAFGLFRFGAVRPGPWTNRRPGTIQGHGRAAALAFWWTTLWRVLHPAGDCLWRAF